MVWIVDDRRGVGDRIAFAFRLISWINAGEEEEEEDVEELVIDWIRYRRIGSLVVFARLVRTGRTALLLIFDQSRVKRPP
jgi:hypothetical protein